MKPNTHGALIYVLSCTDIQSAILTRERIANTVYCLSCEARMFIVRTIYNDYFVTELQVHPGMSRVPYARAL